MEKKQKRILLIAACVLVILIAAAVILYQNFRPKAEKGQKEVSITVIHGDKKETSFEYKTDAEYLREVLEEHDLVKGTEGQYGLFITEVDGEKADDSKQQWWCITKGGEQVNTSANQTPVSDQDEFELTLKEGY